MNSDTFSSVVGGAILVAILVTLYFAHLRHRRRTKRLRLMELLKEYFRGNISVGQLGQRARALAGHYLLRDEELYPLVTAAFHGTVDDTLAHQPHSKDDERKLLSLLAAVKKEFGLTDRYLIEGWRAGRE